MSAILIFLPLVIVMAVYALFWKLAARILRYSGVTWPMAFLVVITIVPVVGFVRTGLMYLGLRFPVPMVLLLGPVLPVFLGAWCFHDRATRQHGQLVGWSAGRVP